MKPDEAERLVSIAKEYYWPAFGRDASSLGLPGSFFESGRGSFATDIFGNCLLDSEMAASANYLGFNLPEVMEAITDEMKRLFDLGYKEAIGGYPWRKTPPGM